MPTTQTIPIDLNTRGANPVAFTHQGDTARAFAFEVYNNGEEFALTGYTAKIGAILPADRGYTVIAGDDMATGSISENTITATLPAAYTAKAGHGLLTIILTGSGGTLRPINIDLRIQKSADADDVIAGASDFPEGLEEIAESVFQEYLSTYLPPVAPSSSAAANKAADAKLTGKALDDLKSDLGSISDLDTTDKTSVVNAINELASSIVETDTTLSVSGAAADSKAVGDIFKEIDAYSVSVLQFESGTIGNDGNTNVANTARARTDFVAVKSGDVMNQLASGYEWFMYRFDSAKNLLDKSSAFESGNYTFSANGYFRLAVKRQDSGTINQTEINSLSESGFNCESSYRKIPVIDSTLTQEGQAADAAAVGEALANLPSGGSGLTNAVKQALLACFQNVAWANANGQTYYNNLITAFTSGDDEGGGGGGSALYPMANGTKTFSNGMVVTVSHGNHVDITGLQPGEQIWNLSDVTSNNSDSSLAANGSAVNNLQTTMFAIPSGSCVDIKILNITASRVDVFGAQDVGNNKTLTLNFRKTGTNTSAFATPLIYPNEGGSMLELSTTTSESLDLSCVLMYASRTRSDHAVDISFDLSVYVDGARWI